MDSSKVDMYKYEGKNVTVHFIDGTKPLTGQCVNFTPDYDNDPEVDSIDIRAGASYITVDLPDIDHIDIID